MTSVQTFYYQMTTTNIKLPCMEDTGLDGKKLYTPKRMDHRKNPTLYKKNLQRGYQADISGQYGTNRRSVGRKRT